MTDGYKTLEREASDSFIIKKSRFTGYGSPAHSEQEALDFLARIRAETKDANHHCYAYIIGRNAGVMRYSDDGEPGGTAGLPIIETMKARGVVDCVVVVTRWFGGILLGAGGLVRAYSRGAVEAIDAAGLVSMEPGIEVQFSVEYPMYGILEGFLREHASDVEADFQEVVRMRMMIAAERADWFQKELIERSNGRVTPTFGGEAYMTRKIKD